VFRPDETVLIGRRIKCGEPESWCLPGGHVEAGETFEAAALREVTEESGISQLDDVRAFTLALCTAGAQGQATVGVVARVSAEVTAAVTEPAAFGEWTWARLTQLPTPLFPASAALIAARAGSPLPAGWTSYLLNRSDASDARRR
jgi:ADP-ribose pyrophosphatase YjhB (NUDIX family)